MKILITSILTLMSVHSAFSAELKYCGKPELSISNSKNFHLLVSNKRNKPKEVVLLDQKLIKQLIDELDQKNSNFICLNGTLFRENRVHFLDKITSHRIY